MTNQVVENRPKELAQTIVEPQEDDSRQMPPPANQTWLDSNIFMENFKNYLAKPLYSHVLEPVGNVSHTYVAGPVYSHVLEPVGNVSHTYVAGPVYSHVLEPVGNASQTYVAGPVYSHVLEPVGNASHSYVIAPVGSAVGQQQQQQQQQQSLSIPNDSEPIKPQPITPLKNPDDLIAQQQHNPPAIH